MNQTSYQVVAHFYAEEGTPALPDTLFKDFAANFCVADALHVHLFDTLVASFDASTHKINNPTTLVARWTNAKQTRQTTN